MQSIAIILLVLLACCLQTVAYIVDSSNRGASKIRAKDRGVVLSKKGRKTGVNLTLPVEENTATAVESSDSSDTSDESDDSDSD